MIDVVAFTHVVNGPLGGGGAEEEEEGGLDQEVARLAGKLDQWCLDLKRNVLVCMYVRCIYDACKKLVMYKAFIFLPDMYISTINYVLAHSHGRNIEHHDVQRTSLKLSRLLSSVTCVVVSV